MSADEMKALIARIQMNADFYGRDSDVVRLANALEAAYDAGRRELAERFATQDATRKAAIEELIAWEDEIEAHVTSGIVSDADGAELAVSSIPALIAEVRRLRALSAHPAEAQDEQEALAAFIASRATVTQEPDGWYYTDEPELARYLLAAGYTRRPAPSREQLIDLLRSAEHAPMSTHDPRDGSCRECPWPVHMLPPEGIADAILTLFERDSDG